MSKHYLVTGGAGFVGSHLCERLVSDGHYVTVLDDISTGQYENIADLENHVRFRLIIDTVLNASIVERLVSECDAVFHLASAVGVRLIMKQPVKTIETIFMGTDTVLRQARRFRRRVLLTSTSEVYGKSTNVPFSEDGDRVEGPTHKHRWAYAAAKALDEFLALAHWKETRLPVVCTRLFNTVGPRQTGQYGMVMPRFVEAALAGEPLIVHGDGTQTRCFCHVQDVVQALIRLMDCTGAAGEVFNVGSQEEVAIAELARRIVAAVGSGSEIVFRTFDAVYGKDGFEDMQRRVPDTTKIQRMIGWKPSYTLDEIIRDVANSLANHSKSQSSLEHPISTWGRS